MRNKFMVICTMAFFIAGFLACNKEGKIANRSSDNSVPVEIKNQILSLGFSPANAKKINGGYLVEGDIILTDSELSQIPETTLLKGADTEQYRTFNLVSGLPRLIRIRVSSDLPSRYSTALDAALARYNSNNLQIRFSRVNSGGDIIITPAPRGSGFLATAGFPSKGNPFPNIQVNRMYLDSWNMNTVTTVLAHEIGHCIGFRHTDYMDRSYSCGGLPVNEGATSAGAIQIYGTPGRSSAGSWMLACIGNGTDRPFTGTDLFALEYLY